MTDREILERAASVLRRHHCDNSAVSVDWVIGKLPPDLDTPTVDVRIAVAVDKDGNGESWVVSPGRESDVYCLSRLRTGKTAAEAIVTARIPLRKVLVVDAKVEAVG